MKNDKVREPTKEDGQTDGRTYRTEVLRFLITNL